MNLSELRSAATDHLREQRRARPQATLTESQRAIAHRHGFPSWPLMKAYLDRLARYPDGLQAAYRADLGYYAERADGLLAAAQDGTPSAVSRFTRAGAPRTPGGARLVLAGAHGYPSWPALRRHVRSLPERGEPFFRAYRAVEEHDPERLRALLEDWPEIITMEGTNGNDLLGMATATCDERTVSLLLEHGAAPSHANAHGWTALHQAGYANAVHLAPLLLEAGARIDLAARGDGGTPLVAALFWGHRETADLLARGGVHPRNLRAAAGVGDRAMVETLLGTAAAGAHRGFYRPHSGFPAWAPSDDRQEVLDEALTYAARSDRVEVLDMLVEAGARLDADPYRGTPLVWAAACGRAAAVARLLALGADPMGRGSYGGESHGRAVTPLHLAGASGDLPTIQILLDAGAHPAVLDGHGYGTPAGWARHDGYPEAAALIEAHGRGER